VGFCAGSDGFVAEAREIVMQTLELSSAEEKTDYGVIKEKVRADLKRYISKQTQRRPLIMPVILEIYCAMVTLEDIQSRAERIAGVAVRTNPFLIVPLIEPEGQSYPGFGSSLRQPENLQPVGAFKVRGAYNKIAALSEAERRPRSHLLLERETMPRAWPMRPAHSGRKPSS